MDNSPAHNKMYKSCKSIDVDLDCLSLDGMEGTKKRNSTRKMTRKFSSLSLSCEKDAPEAIEQTYNIKDEYDIIETLGMGTYSYVRHGIEKDTERHVAIKTSRGNNSREMLQKEYELLKRLADDNIVKVYDFVEDKSKNESYIIMEYFEGLTLDEHIEKHGVLSENDAKEVIKQILTSIEGLHDLGIAHRDIKPENVLINSSLEIKLIDFNISKASPCQEPFRPEKLQKFNSIFHTQISSPLYCAPELKNSLTYSESVDIWGAGVILFTLLLGSFKSYELSQYKDPAERWQAIAEIVSRQDMPEYIKEMLFTTLACNPEERPTAKDLLNNGWWIE